MDAKRQSGSSKELLQAEIHMNGVPSMLQIGQKTTPEKRETFRPPPSSILTRVRDFLPVMAKANAALDERKITDGPDALDIEYVEDCEGPVIEMNLALMEQQQGDCDSDSDKSSLESASESSSEDDDDNSCECEENGTSSKQKSRGRGIGHGRFSEITTQSIKLPNGTSVGRKRCEIEVLEADSDRQHSHNQSAESSLRFDSKNDK